MEVIFLRQAYKFVQKSDKPLREKIQKEIFKLQANPSLGRLLSGEILRNIRSHRFFHVSVSYRIAYQVEENIVIIAIASRENFYRNNL